MRYMLLVFAFCLMKFITCHESDSAEANRLDFPPFYDTVIFSDVIDIMNELNKNMKMPFNVLASSESESDENIEDLLSEYQHYLDKAHDQRRLYLEKTNRTKNKVPPLRRENYLKTNIPSIDRYTEFYNTNSYYNNPSTIKFPPTTYNPNNPFNLFLPVNPSFKFLSRPDQGTIFRTNKEFKDDTIRYDKFSPVERKPFNLPLPNYYKSTSDPIKSSCFCKPGQFPCKCKCKQCLIPIDPMVKNEKELKFIFADGDRKPFHQTPIFMGPQLPDQTMDELDNNGNNLNVRIKVDIQLPRIQDGQGKFNKYHDSALENDENSRESFQNIKIPTTYFNFPIPMNMFGYKNIKSSRLNKHESLHKMTIHKKKKSRSGNSNNKKHRKKLITFHNIKLSSSQQTLRPILIENHSNGNNNYSIGAQLIVNATATPTDTFFNATNTNFNSTESPKSKNVAITEDRILFMVNISNNNENETDDIHKTGNSIELEYKTISNTTTETIPTYVTLRKKRNAPQNQTEKPELVKVDLMTNTTKVSMSENSTAKLITVDSKNATKEEKNDTITKKIDRGVLSDTDLLYWPLYAQNKTTNKVKNITDIIVERENKKAKLNITKDTIRQNRTIALEQAIFGKVDWNDMDAVAPTFISFVGKYINGVLTFCSEKICHSMRCAEKRCVHRTCVPEERFNSFGHCTGCNNTDSVVSMESIMDLPSNVAFEIVDILQDKMLGKLYGKVTLCISSKCISLATSKKVFLKSKCIAKNLNKAGHCSNKKS